jgi:hypothetical protein
MREWKSSNEGSFIIYEAPVFTKMLNIKATETVCVPECSNFGPCGSVRWYAPGLIFHLVFSLMTYGPSHFDSSLSKLSVRGLRKRTRMPTSNSLFLTFGSLQDFISSWYFYKLVTALSMFDSSKSFSSASLGHGDASVVVRKL